MLKPETILKQIVKQYGVTILAQSRLKGLILDMMPNAERKYINVLKRAVDEKLGAKLLEIQNDDESIRNIKIKTLIEKFKNDNAFDDTAIYIVDCFVHAIDWNNTEPEIILPFKEINIGDQIWADRNLDICHFRNGDPIPEAKTDEEWKNAGENKQPAWCYYKNDPENGEKYGKLYNWYAVNDPRGLAPQGWQIPNNNEWTKLTNFLGGHAIAGTKMKKSSDRAAHGSGYDSSSFSAIQTGIRGNYGYFGMGIDNGMWWSSSEDNDYSAWLWAVCDRGVEVVILSNYKSFGYSVRCNKHTLADYWKKSVEARTQGMNKKDYLEVSIGNQVWMKKNLDVDCFINGDPIFEARTDEEWEKAGHNKQPAWCYYNNVLENGKKYGKLYNWYAVKDLRGLAPEGWHVPSDEEWMQLIAFLGGEDIVGLKLKSNTGWKDSGSSTDVYGFSVLPGGYREVDGEFHGVGDYSFWWCASESNIDEARSWLMVYQNGYLQGLDGYKELGFSVRCLRD